MNRHARQTLQRLAPRLPATDAHNHEGARAYRFGARHQLAQYAATGCIGDTFYATAEAQLGDVLALAAEVPPEFIARTAVWTREKGFMKDLPALLVALLTVESPELAERIFPRVIDDGRMLRSFVEILRSGATGRRSLGSLPRRLVRAWLERRTDEQLVRASIGQSPSLADVVKMAHPRPSTPSRRALYGWLLGKQHDATALPEVLRAYEALRASGQGPVGDELPDVPFQMLTDLPLSEAAWRTLALRATWTQLRMSLATFQRHGVLARREVLAKLVAKLRDPVEVQRARVMPYQLLVAYLATGDSLPGALGGALHDAMEAAIANVPALEGQVFVCPDVSGSMHSPVTGRRGSATTAARCVDVAALVAASVLRRNPTAVVLPFEHAVVSLQLDGRDSVMTNARKLGSIGGGGTSCSAPLAVLNRRRARGDLVILVSDNESWVDERSGRGTETMVQWEQFKRRNPKARLVCIDIQPNTTTQAGDRADILNIGGFSDAVFEVIAAFARGRADHWVDVIEKVDL